MKKILLFFVALLCSFAAAMAQVNYVATLQHGDSITNYYGGGAFEQAYNASEDGDVITLSAGTFSFGPYHFKKGITVRGTGIDATQGTYISSAVRFYSEEESKTASIEGVIFNAATYVVNHQNEGSFGKINFIKDRFLGNLEAIYEGNPTKTGPIVRLYNCVASCVCFRQDSNPDFMIYNSCVECVISYLSTHTISAYINCNVTCASDYISGHYYNPSSYLNLYNCIIKNGNYRDEAFQNTVTCYNCISIAYPYLFTHVVSGGNNKTVGSAEDIYKTYINKYSKGETFELTDEAKETYIGTDGTQIGMQGGIYPYNSTVQYPVITKFESVPQTTKEGILSIDVQVDGK